jgi:site-specific recombinase XerD
MRKLPHFVSLLAERMVQFMNFKHMQGYDYTDGQEALLRFDSFLSRTQCPGPVLRREDLDGYCKDLRQKQLGTQAKLLSTVRQFSHFLRAMEPESEVLSARILPRRPQTIRFYPLSTEQVGELMATIPILRPGSGIRPACLRFLIGLLYSTGLRIGEALALNLGDVDQRQGSLFVRDGKRHKERLVLMSASTLDALQRWLCLRHDYAGNEANAPLLVSGWNQRLKNWQAARAFARLCAHCGITGSPAPRLHDLRHNYACRCLALWREANEDVDALLPVLANAMGHVDFRSTQLYMHIDAVALQQAAAKFHNHVYDVQEISK